MLNSENRVNSDQEPYRMLSMRVIMKAIDDNDTRYLRGWTDDLRFWLHCSNISFETFHNKMWLRFPRKARAWSRA